MLRGGHDVNYVILLQFGSDSHQVVRNTTPMMGTAMNPPPT